MKRKNLGILLTISLAALYLFLFIKSFHGRILNPDWATDDSLQQSFILHDVFNPAIFKGDLIYEVMKGYLPPLHYWLSYALTLASGSPIMAGHLVMMIQFMLTLLFLFLGIRAASDEGSTEMHTTSKISFLDIILGKIKVSIVPAIFACIWFLHTRTVIQRLSGGLPRGWAAVIFAGFLWGILSRRHRLTVAMLILGCLIHPPAAFLCGVSYGIWLIILICGRATRTEGVKSIKALILASPICGFITWLVIKRPPEIGSMVDYSTASQMPSFTNPGGRFPFIPQPAIWEHFHSFGYNAFINKLFEPLPLIKEYGWLLIFGLLFAIFIWGLKSKRELVPNSLWAFLLGIISVYLVSRQVLFKLYVPDRHLLIPMTFFLISAFTLASWNLSKQWQGLRLLGLSILIYLCSGSGLTGDSQINYHIYRKGHAFEWIKKYSPTNSIVAGHPTQVDPVPLFAARKVYVSSEVTHPFYKTFYEEMERRLIVSLKAHYARSWSDFISLIKPEKIDYFIFSRQRFYPNNLKNEGYYIPLDTLVRELCSYPSESYVYKTLPRKVNLESFPFVKYIDAQSTVIDVNELISYIKKNPQFGAAARVHQDS